MRRELSALPTLLRIGLAEAVAYRAEMVVWMLTMTMPLVSLALWSAVADVAPVAGFASGDFAAYFLATLVVRQVTGSWVVWEMNQEIRSGTLVRRLLRPVSPLLTYACEGVAAVPLRSLVALPFAVAGLVATGGSRLPHDATTWVAWGVSMVGAWLLGFALLATLGALAFYLESTTALFDAYMALFLVLSGYLVPLELLPAWVRAVARALPLRYTLATPVEILVGRLPRAALAGELAAQWAWVVAAWAVATFAFRRGVRRFAAYGG